MINPLKVASAGYLKRGTKAVLIISVAGYLNFGGTPIPPIPVNPSGGGQFVGAPGRNTSDDEYLIQREKRFRILKDDDEVLAIIKMWLKCQE